MFASDIDPPSISRLYPPDARILSLSQDDAEFLEKVQSLIGGLDKVYLRDTCRTEGCNNKLEKKHHYCSICIKAREMAQDREYRRKSTMEKVLVKLKGGSK